MKDEAKRQGSPSPLTPLPRERGTGFISIALATIVLSGCVQKMSDEPRYEAYEASALFADGKSARPIPYGTVPRAGVSERDTADIDPAYQTGYENGKPLEALPERVSKRYELRELLERGEERFSINCVPCHGLIGDGNGMVPRRGFPYPPTYHSERLRAVPIGYIVGVITAGHGRMPSYGKQVPPDDRWAIATYVRALQLSRHAETDTLSDADRSALPSRRAP
jgi:mono/diheme cytochrome c family protein